MNNNETEGNYRQLEFAPIQAQIKKLQTDRHYRDTNNLFYAEGVRNFVTAVDYHYPIETLIYSEKLLTSLLARKFVRQLKRAGVPFTRITPEQFRSVSETERASGVAFILRQQILKPDQLKLANQFCWTALSVIRSPGNFGTLIRTSAATGADGFVLIGNHIDPYDPNVVRATMGALFKQKIMRAANVEEFEAWARNHNFRVIGASPGGSVSYSEISYRAPIILMLGNERSGLTADEQIVCHELVRIPMTDETDSLNVAIAGSLLLYEVLRSAHQK